MPVMVRLCSDTSTLTLGGLPTVQSDMSEALTLSQEDADASL